MFFFCAGKISHARKFKRISVAGVIYIDNGGAVALDYYILIGLIRIQREVSKRFRVICTVHNCCGLCIELFVRMIGIPVIIGVFRPINNGVGRIRRFPLCTELEICCRNGERA